jgi:hypothetical protein
MGLTLDELQLVLDTMERAPRTNCKVCADINRSIDLVKREIRLKTVDFITMTDVNGNVMDDQ